MQLYCNKKRTYLICLGMLVTNNLPLRTSCLGECETAFKTFQPVHIVHAEKKESQLMLFAGLENGTIKICLDFNANNPIYYLLKGHSAAVNAMDSYDQHYLFSSSLDQTFCIWDIMERKCIFKKSKLPCTGIKSMGKLLFISTENGGVQIWDWGNQLPIRTFEVPDKGKITSFELSENGQFFFAGSDCNNLYVWDLIKGSSAPFNTTKEAAANFLLYQEGILFIGTRDGNIKSWRWQDKTNPQIYCVSGKKAGIMSLSVRRDYLYAVLNNGSVIKCPYPRNTFQPKLEKVIDIAEKIHCKITTMCYQDAQWFFSTENKLCTFYMKEKEESKNILHTLFSSKKNSAKENPVNRPTPSVRTIRQLNAAQQGWLTEKQMLDYFIPFADMFLGTNPEVLKRFTQNDLKEEWLDAIKFADKKKIDALLEPKYRNLKTSSLDLILHKDKHNRNILHFAVLKANLPLLKYLFQRHKKKITPLLNQTTNKGLSPMDIAYKTDFITALFLLHRNGAKPVKYAPKPSSQLTSTQTT